MIFERVWVFSKYVAFVPYIALYIVFFLVVEMGVLGRSKKKENTEALPVKENPKTE